MFGNRIQSFEYVRSPNVRLDTPGVVERRRKRARSGKRKKKKKKKKRRGNCGENGAAFPPQEPPALSPVPTRFIFAFALLVFVFPTIWEYGTGYTLACRDLKIFLAITRMEMSLSNSRAISWVSSTSSYWKRGLFNTTRQQRQMGCPYLRGSIFPVSGCPDTPYRKMIFFLL